MSVKYAPIVQLDKGLVRGIVQQVDDSEIYLYQGIRYGKANRFEKPQPVEPWTGVYHATTPRDNPPQLGVEIPSKGYFSRTISEDCLMLNVWKPIRESTTPRAVMVYIFGGRYQTGSIYKLTNDLRWIAHRGDVIGVTMNYRLGPFGFMFGDDREAPANLCLHDLILGFQWIQENISKFGGNPKSVTIFGNSSGSIIVGALILSPLTRGLFRRASLQSGHPLEIKHKTKFLHIIKSIGQHLNCDDDNSNEMIQLVKNLKNKSIEEILNATRELKLNFEVVYGDEVLPMKPLDALISGSYNTDIDLMYGQARDEGIVHVLVDFPEFNDEKFELKLDRVREYIIKIVGKEHGDAVADFYFKKNGLSETSSQEDLINLVFQVHADHMFTAGMTLTGEQHAKHSKVHNRQVFAWQLVQPADVHIVTCWSPKFPGVYHADELFYLFTITRQNKPEAVKLSHDLIKAWTQFAKNGDPGTVGKERWLPAVESDDDFSTKFMALGYESKMVSGNYREMCDFWNGKLFSLNN